MLLAEGGCRSAGSRPATSWNAAGCWRPITICAVSTPPRRSCAVLFHQGAPALGDGALRSEQGLAALRQVSATRLSPAGQLQIATALDVIAALETQLHELRHQLLDAARHLAGAKVLAARLCGVGPVTALAMTCWLGGRAGSPPPAKRSGSPGWTSPSGPPIKGPPGRLSRQGPPVLRWALYEAGKTHARSSQDRPAGLPYPGRARRRRPRRRLTPLYRHGDQPMTGPAWPGPPQPNSPDGDHRGQLPPNRCQPLPGLLPQGRADGLIRPSGRIPAGGDTQSIIMSPGQRPSPADLGKAGCSWPRPRPPRLITRTERAPSLNR
jgi:hypothetical protein